MKNHPLTCIKGGGLRMDKFLLDLVFEQFEELKATDLIIEELKSDLDNLKDLIDGIEAKMEAMGSSNR